jgi:hypothetical protein
MFSNNTTLQFKSLFYDFLFAMILVANATVSIKS